MPEIALHTKKEYDAMQATGCGSLLKTFGAAKNDFENIHFSDMVMILCSNVLFTSHFGVAVTFE